MYFSDRELRDLGEQYESVSQKCDSLNMGYLGRDYNDSRAKEFAHQGYLRRVTTLVRCIENVFELLPPERAEIPNREDRKDAEINNQASVLNTFGCIDNLAWIWVKEKNIIKADGSTLPRSWVGLGKENKFIRASFSADFQKYLPTIDDWFEHLVDFRDALAHRVPLYIPPYTVGVDNQEEYLKLDGQKMEASRFGDIAEHDRLDAEQMALVAFRLWMQHSYIEEAKPTVFHAQLLTNFNTINELGNMILEELDR